MNLLLYGCTLLNAIPQYSGPSPRVILSSRFTLRCIQEPRSSSAQTAPHLVIERSTLFAFIIAKAKSWYIDLAVFYSRCEFTTRRRSLVHPRLTINAKI